MSIILIPKYWHLILVFRWSVVSSASTNIYFQQITLRTNDIAIAELTGILRSLVWLTTNIPKHNTIHIMCDNQYVTKSIL